MILLFVEIIDDDRGVAAGEEVAPVRGWVMCRESFGCGWIGVGKGGLGADDD